MTASERETAPTVRSAHVAHFLSPDWGRIARIAAPALERITRDSSALQLLVIVPDASATLGLARAIAALSAAEGRRVVAATSAARAKRLLAAGPAHVAIGSPATLAPLMAASALKLDQVATVLFASADEFNVDDADLSTILSEVPKGAARILTALDASSTVEALIERYMHKARRVGSDTASAADAPTTPNIRFLTVGGAPVESLPAVLDEVDAPSATIVATDPAAAAAARTLLAAIGYPEGSLARVTEEEVFPNSALVVLLGVPSGHVWANVVAAQPAQVVALIPSREHAALQRLAGPTPVQPFAARAAVLKARATDARARAELRELLAGGIPYREVLALEPLLGEFDGLEIAAAALRLLEQTRLSQTTLVHAAEIRVRAVMKEAMAAREAELAASPAGEARPAAAPREERAERGEGERMNRPRGGERGGERGGARGGPRPYSPRGDRSERGEASDRGERPRSFGARSDKPKTFGARGDKPRSFAPRSEKPSFGPRGDKPSFGPRSDKPRGPRRDDGGRGAPRGPR